MSDTQHEESTEAWRRFQAQHLEAQTLAAQDAAAQAHRTANNIETLKQIAVALVVLMVISFFLTLTTVL